MTVRAEHGSRPQWPIRHCTAHQQIGWVHYHVTNTGEEDGSGGTGHNSTVFESHNRHTVFGYRFSTSHRSVTPTEGESMTSTSTPEVVSLNRLRDHVGKTLMFTANAQRTGSSFTIGCQSFDAAEVFNLGGIIDTSGGEAVVSFPGRVTDHTYVQVGTRSLLHGDMGSYCQSAAVVAQATAKVNCKLGFFRCRDHRAHWFFLATHADETPVISRLDAAAGDWTVHHDWTEFPDCYPVYARSLDDRNLSVHVEALTTQFQSVDRVS